MAMEQVAHFVDLLGFAFAFGATVWFFFLQSPSLVKAMGRDKFVPIQMRLTKLLFTALPLMLLVVLAASVAGKSLQSHATYTAAVALIAALINRFAVLPAAFRAAGPARAEARARPDGDSVAGFAVDGVGSGTKALHRLVVLFVLVMLVALLLHGLHIVID